MNPTCPDCGGQMFHVAGRLWECARCSKQETSERVLSLGLTLTHDERLRRHSVAREDTMEAQVAGARCPRCDGPLWAGEYHPAVSRTDDATDVCAPCGLREALEQYAGVLAPQAAWPVG